MEKELKTSKKDVHFNRAFHHLLAIEGGLNDDPDDYGGLTKFGISQRSYPDLDIANLTEEGAREIYYADWWKKYRYFELLDSGVSTKMLDISINVGPDDAGLYLQRALRATGKQMLEDGIVGSKTIKAANQTIGPALLAALKSEVASHYRLQAQSDEKIAEILDGLLNRAYS